ncbi:hypothetical protein BST95_11630 [Halioglobus japonicus]|uniref:DUF3267 domain-containing protein n=1 Tax=Halioglobus japonicus TaxID=930805 RepID=A0AAP8MG72_9GAMM|nr:DUF3267 domain-containing protein [Halioglobus japonicus]AQA18792.1 hypothetical protein BST95_11630 [Halioglobus japonicus]PLW86824.1 DUF3267 domain-containing protein [Halioglobus japonicus]
MKVAVIWVARVAFLYCFYQILCGPYHVIFTIGLDSPEIKELWGAVFQMWSFYIPAALVALVLAIPLSPRIPDEIHFRWGEITTEPIPTPEVPENCKPLAYDVSTKTFVVLCTAAGVLVAAPIAVLSKLLGILPPNEPVYYVIAGIGGFWMAPFHEGIHAAAVPARFRESLWFGVWPKRLLMYVFFSAELSVGRMAYILMLPFLLLTVLPMIATAFTSHETAYFIAAFALGHAMSCGGDFMSLLLILRKTPAKAVLLFTHNRLFLKMQ